MKSIIVGRMSRARYPHSVKTWIGQGFFIPSWKPTASHILHVSLIEPNSADKLNHGSNERQKMCSAGGPTGQGLKTPGIGLTNPVYK